MIPSLPSLSFFHLSLLSLCSLLPSLFPLLFLCFMQSLINHMATATHRTSLRPIKCISSFHLSIYLPPTPLTRPPPPLCTALYVCASRACVLSPLRAPISMTATATTTTTTLVAAVSNRISHLEPHFGNVLALRVNQWGQQQHPFDAVR